MAHVFTQTLTELSPYIRKELELTDQLFQGSSGIEVRRVQEWLNLHGLSVVVDDDFGPATAQGVERFQEKSGLHLTGEVDSETFDFLVAPMRQVLEQRLNSSMQYNEVVVDYARMHEVMRPKEVGSPNSGPWVRLYMAGQEGTNFPWCAGFVSFVLHQAADALQIDVPIQGSTSCDTLVKQGRDAGLFLTDSEVSPSDLTPGSIFLVRRNPTDWNHTGFVIDAYETAFDTIEGNTNDSGHREGVEVCARTRAYGSKDFIIL